MLYDKVVWLISFTSDLVKLIFFSHASRLCPSKLFYKPYNFALYVLIVVQDERNTFFF